MVLIEDITDSYSAGEDGLAESSSELRRTLKALSARLALPEELLPSFLEEDKRKVFSSRSPVMTLMYSGRGAQIISRSFLVPSASDSTQDNLSGMAGAVRRGAD